MEGPFTIVEHVGNCIYSLCPEAISRNVSIDCDLQDKAKRGLKR